MGSDLKAWVSDKLMSLIGFSQPTLVQYVISLSKKASSPSDVYNHLKDMQMSSLSDTHAFAEEIFRKVEHKSSGSNVYRQREEAAAMLARKQRNYKLLADADDESGEHGSSVKSKKTDKKAKSFRKKRETKEDEDDEGAVNLKEDRLVRQKVSRDDSDDGIEAIRRFSRQEYFKKREQKKLEEIRDDIVDEEYLFGDVKVSEIEQRNYRYKKQIYEVVTKRSQEDDNMNTYRMPDAYDAEGGVNQEKRFAVATERYRDLKDGDKMNPSAEQEAWEDHQISMF
ncbi:putative RNA helicase [Helianthus annuus]|nr:putative RNA helicase [Helianthus annuus]